MTTARQVQGGPIDQNQFAFDGTIAVSVGDLMYHDTNDVKPFSSQADGGSEAINQLSIAPLFAGVSHEARTVSETGALTNFPVVTDWVGEMDCASATFEVGDLLAPCANAGVTGLENQKLKKTTDPALAIGYATQRYASATTRVACRLISRVCPHMANKQPLDIIEVSYLIPLHASKTIFNVFTAREAVQILSIDYTPDTAQGGALTATVVKATGTATPASATTPMCAAGAIDLNAAAHTVQSIALSATVADLKLAAGERIGFVESGAMTVGSGNLSIRMKRI